MTLRVNTYRCGEWQVLVIGGELDLDTCADLREPLIRAIDAEGGRVVLDLAPLAFLDSSGLGMLVTAQKRANESGGELRMVQPAQAVHRIFQVTGLDQIFTFFPTAEDAAGQGSVVEAP